MMNLLASDRLAGALHLGSVEELLLLRRGVADRQHDLAGLAGLEAALHDGLLVRGHLPCLLHDDGVRTLGVRGELGTVANLPAEHPELPYNR